MITATGRLGQSVTFDGRYVVVRKRRGEFSVPLDAVQAVGFGRLPVRERYIRFTVAGHVTMNARGNLRKRILADDYAVLYWAKRESEFTALRDAFNAARSGQAASPLA